MTTPVVPPVITTPAAVTAASGPDVPLDPAEAFAALLAVAVAPLTMPIAAPVPVPGSAAAATVSSHTKGTSTVSGIPTAPGTSAADATTGDAQAASPLKSFRDAPVTIAAPGAPTLTPPSSPRAASGSPAPQAMRVLVRTPSARDEVHRAPPFAGVPALQLLPVAPQTDGPVSTVAVRPALVEAARHLKRDGDSASLVIRLDPAELGAVLVRLAVKHGQVDVQLRTPDLAAQADLRAQQADVQQVLQDAGLDLSSFDVGHGDAGRSQTPDRGTPRQQHRTDGHANVMDDVPHPELPGTWL